jgi:SAM-dependent methyltransferase
MRQIPCPICGSINAVEPADQEYRRCSHCGTVRTKFDYNEKMYGDSYAENYEEYAETKINTPLQLCRLGMVSRWLRPNDRILDIGCCIGEFLRFAEGYYFCEGFEPNKTAVKKQRCEATIHTELNGSIHSANCITMFDVLEHIQKPKEFLEFICNRYLKTDGVLLLTTPNVEALETWNDHALRTWKHYKPKEHLFLYSERGLEVLLNSADLEVIHWGREESDIRPGNPNGDIMTCVARRMRGR